MYLLAKVAELKVVGTQLTNKTHFYCEKLNSYEHLQILWGKVPPWFRHLCLLGGTIVMISLSVLNHIFVHQYTITITVMIIPAIIIYNKMYDRLSIKIMILIIDQNHNIDHDIDHRSKSQLCG